MPFKITQIGEYKSRNGDKIIITHNHGGSFGWPLNGHKINKDGKIDNNCTSWSANGIWACDLRETENDIIGFWDGSETLSVPSNKVLLLLKRDKTTTTNQRKTI